MTDGTIAPDPHGHVGQEVEVPHIEADESVPPRPEEEIADVARQAPRGTEGSGESGS